MMMIEISQQASFSKKNRNIIIRYNMLYYATELVVYSSEIIILINLPDFYFTLAIRFNINKFAEKSSDSFTMASI